MDKEEINVKSESVSAEIPNISPASVSAGSADRENNKRIFNASVRWIAVLADSADAANDKISLREPIARV